MCNWGDQRNPTPFFAFLDSEMSRRSIRRGFMQTDEFSAALRSLAPSPSELNALGMSPTRVKTFLASFECNRRDSTVDRDPILDLCSHFDLGSVEVGLVRLSGLKKFDASHWQIGLVEADPLLYGRADGHVTCRDHATPNFEIFKCANSGEAFLTAMIHVASALNAQLFNRPEKDRIAVDALRRCTDDAGEDTAPFYRMLLGL
jgi:hypothetical protein